MVYVINGRPRYQNGFRIPIIAIVLIIVGIFLAAIYFKGASELATKKNNFVEVDAKVIDHVYKNGRPVSAVLQYTVNDGIYQTVSNSSDNSSKTNGAIVKIRYNPNKPTDIVFVDAHENVLIIISSIILFAIGIAIVIVSFINLAKHKERKGTVLEGVPVYHSNSNDNEKKVLDRKNLTDESSSTAITQKVGLNDILSKPHNEDQSFNNQNPNNTNINAQNTIENTYTSNQIDIQTNTINNNINNIAQNAYIEPQMQGQISTTNNNVESQISNDVINNNETVSINTDDKLNELEIDSNLSDNDIIGMINTINNANTSININNGSNINTQDNNIVNIPNNDNEQPVVMENVIPEPISETQRLRGKLEILKHKNNINTDSYTTPEFMSRSDEGSV